MHAQCSSSGGDTACLAYDNWQMGVKIKIQKSQICCNANPGSQVNMITI